MLSFEASGPPKWSVTAPFAAPGPPRIKAACSAKAPMSAVELSKVDLVIAGDQLPRNLQGSSPPRREDDHRDGAAGERNSRRFRHGGRDDKRGRLGEAAPAIIGEDAVADEVAVEVV